MENVLEKFLNFCPQNCGDPVFVAIQLDSWYSFFQPSEGRRSLGWFEVSVYWGWV